MLTIDGQPSVTLPGIRPGGEMIIRNVGPHRLDVTNAPPKALEYLASLEKENAMLRHDAFKRQQRNIFVWGCELLVLLLGIFVWLAVVWPL